FKLSELDSISNKQETNIHQHIIFENVTFKYSENDAEVLKELNFKVPKGSMVGIVGESGAGKSTIINLLLGLLSPTNGKVLVDNNDIKKNLKAWQKQIGYVPQTIYLTDDSVTNNIALGVPQKDIKMDKVMDCIAAINLSKLIDQLPHGIDSLVGERGVRISGGQLQRLGLARALYNDPQVLILDEATSSLDIETEEKIMKIIKNFQGLKTIFIISHRMSTLKYCDQIFNVSNGRLHEAKNNK
ncbi:ABC transporter ATP-binding protein, partial [Candidatus Pseudothioglobus singularis]|nr:ABC transporter ATP-binding protein [Candidatus Pseudothioglobus singularis]